jgi:hypothetical protein
MNIDIGNVTINLFNGGEFDIRTFIDMPDDDTLSVDMNDKGQQSALFFGPEDLHKDFIVDL